MDSGYHEGNGSIVQRVYTGIVFLNAVVRGGELIFPLHSFESGAYPSIEKLCSESHGLGREPLKVAPRQGLAVFFQNHASGERAEWGDRIEAAVHGSCPVLEQGGKWILQLWMRSGARGFW